MARLTAHVLLVWTAAIVCMVPRFNRTDSLFGIRFRSLTTEGLGDTEAYITFVGYYRGLGPPPQLPFAQRPLTPYLASLLPC